MENNWGKEWKDYISHEKVLKTFTTDIETAAYINMIMQHYALTDQSQTIDTLVNLGLVFLGYKDRSEVLKDISLKNKESMGNISKPEEKSKFDVMAFSSLKEPVDEQVASIIISLCKQSSEGYTTREEIIKEGESQLISAVNIVGAIDKLKRNGIIYEPVANQYKSTKDLEIK